MSTEDVYLEAGDHMEKAVEALEHQLRSIRTGRASPALVDHLRIDYYGAQTPLGQIANIAAPEPQLIVIRPFDPSVVKTIEKAILQSDIGITPNCDGKLIRLAVPPLSEERRKQLASQIRQMGEQTKVAIRNVRRDANRDVEKMESDSVISEDDAFKSKEEIQELTKESESKVDAILARKTEEIMKF
jgi:ribosome recycling factor